MEVGIVKTGWVNEPAAGRPRHWRRGPPSGPVAQELQWQAFCSGFRRETVKVQACKSGVEIADRLGSVESQEGQECKRLGKRAKCVGKPRGQEKAKQPRKLDPDLKYLCEPGCAVRRSATTTGKGACQSLRQLICPIHLMPHLPFRRAAIGGRPALPQLAAVSGWRLGSAVVRAAAHYPSFRGGACFDAYEISLSLQFVNSIPRGLGLGLLRCSPRRLPSFPLPGTAVLAPSLPPSKQPRHRVPSSSGGGEEVMQCRPACAGLSKLAGKGIELEGATPRANQN